MGDLNQWLWGVKRSQTDRLFMGVCAGIAEAAQIDATLVRLAFVVLALAHGLGVGVYLLLWLVLPLGDTQEGDGYTLTLGYVVRSNLSHFHDEASQIAVNIRTRTAPGDEQSKPERSRRRRYGWALVFVGVLLLLHSFGLFSWVTGMRAIGLVIVFSGIALLWRLSAASKER